MLMDSRKREENIFNEYKYFDDRDDEYEVLNVLPCFQVGKYNLVSFLISVKRHVLKAITSCVFNTNIPF